SPHLCYMYHPLRLRLPRPPHSSPTRPSSDLQQATETGVTPAQHQLLLAIRGHHESEGPTIGDVADALLLRHHSVVGLVDRAADRSEEHTSELQSPYELVCRLLLEKKKPKRCS